MEANDILALVRAGYTKEEISAMGTVPSQVEVPTPAVQNPTPAPAPVPDGNTDPYPVAEPTPTPTPAPVAVAEPVPAPTQEQAQPSTSDIMREIARLTSAVQANAIANSSLPVQSGMNLDNVMANIIKPTRGNQNG